MQNWFEPADRALLLARLDRLSPGHTARWGRMTVQQVVCHMADLVRVALGEKPSAPMGWPTAWPGISWLAVWVLPWIKGVPTAPELRAGTGMTEPGEFARDKEELVRVLEEFTSRPPGQEFAPSPAFGRMSRATWGRFMWRHMNHHLTQFGV